MKPSTPPVTRGPARSPSSPSGALRRIARAFTLVELVVVVVIVGVLAGIAAVSYQSIVTVADDRAAQSQLEQLYKSATLNAAAERRPVTAADFTTAQSDFALAGPSGLLAAAGRGLTVSEDATPAPGVVQLRFAATDPTLVGLATRSPSGACVLLRGRGVQYDTAVRSSGDCSGQAAVDLPDPDTAAPQPSSEPSAIPEPSPEPEPVLPVLAADWITGKYAGRSSYGAPTLGGPAINSPYSGPIAVARSKVSDTVYLADNQARRVLAVDATGHQTLFAGNGAATASGDGGPATAAAIVSPSDVLALPDGSVLIADRNGHAVRRVTPDGVITTFAGTGVPGYNGDNQPATAAQLSSPRALALSTDGLTVYIADGSNYRVRAVRDGVITTAAGSGAYPISGDGGPATAAGIATPMGVAVGANGVLYITSGHAVRQVGSDGVISTFAGQTAFGFAGDGGPATSARMSGPTRLLPLPTGDVLIADSNNNRIRRVDPSGVITTVAGNGTSNGYGTAGNGGPATQAGLMDPMGMLQLPDGTVVVAEQGARTFRSFSPPS